MKSLKPSEVAAQRREYSPWNPKMPKPKPKDQETVEEFIARGGKVVVCDPPSYAHNLNSICCTNTLERLV